ncbi:MAG: type II toxin-antitoxin system VapC family toxin [bacterium]|nr:type II toxin-antitoxin system VapC family toxin [bacterium]
MSRAWRLLLDTHIWYWYVDGSAELAGSLRDVIDEAFGACWLSPISLWELGVLVRKRRIRLHADLGDWVRDALAGFPVQEAAVNFEVADRVRTLDLRHGDPADHFLAATALVYDLSLVTLDQRLVEASWLATVTV